MPAPAEALPTARLRRTHPVRQRLPQHPRSATPRCDDHALTGLDGGGDDWFAGSFPRQCGAIIHPDPLASAVMATIDPNSPSRFRTSRAATPPPRPASPLGSHPAATHRRRLLGDRRHRPAHDGCLDGGRCDAAARAVGLVRGSDLDGNGFLAFYADLAGQHDPAVSSFPARGAVRG